MERPPMSVADVTLPPAFEPWRRPSPVLEALGPFAAHRDDPMRSGFPVTANKLNARGLLHAGVVSTFADVAIGHALVAASGEAVRFVTIGLHCEFLGAATLGDWVDAEVVPRKLGRRVASGAIVMAVDGKTIATAQALFVPA